MISVILIFCLLYHNTTLLKKQKIHIVHQGIIQTGWFDIFHQFWIEPNKSGIFEMNPLALLETIT